MLGAKNTATKFAAEDALRKAIVSQQRIQSFSITPDSSQVTA